MKSFDLLRYLKKWWFLIMLITAVGCLGVYEFISSRQSYTATAIIQYTNANASQGKNADGSRIDPTEITSASVINQTIQQLGLTASTESIRSKISVKEVIPEDEQTKKETALADGEEYEYYPTIYAVSFTVASKDATDYARKMALDMRMIDPQCAGHGADELLQVLQRDPCGLGAVPQQRQQCLGGELRIHRLRGDPAQ